MQHTPSLRVAILLATYNGAANLLAQLESYLAQDLPPALLIVSDDGSSDGSPRIAAEFAARHPELPLLLLSGPRQGSALNFLHMLKAVPDDIDVVAFSDQDDVWLPHKLRRGVAALCGVDPARPALSTGTSIVCDCNLNQIGRLPLPARPPSFRNALVQNIAAGNTMMLNRAGLDLLKAASTGVRELVVHDWWIYQIVTGAGGIVTFDPDPVRLYRQHEGNLIGANHGARAKARRIGLLLIGRFQEWNSINLKALKAAQALLTPEHNKMLHEFDQMRGKRLLSRVQALQRLGLYRQGRAGTASLWLATLLGKI